MTTNRKDLLVKDKLNKLKAKYSYIWEAQSPSVLLVASGVIGTGLAGYILLDKYKTIQGASELATALLLSGVRDYALDDGNILRVTLVKE